MKRFQLVSPGTLERMRKQAQQAFEERDFAKCVETLERARKLAPGDVGILMQLGRVQGLVYHYDAARECFEQAIRLAPRKAEALAYAGEQSRDFRDPRIAEHYYTQAIAQPDASPDSLVKAAEFNELMRRMDEAGALVARALALAPTFGPALFAKARLENRAGRHAEAESTLRTLLGQATGRLRARACYELGAILDRQKRYDEAMQCFLEAKAILKPDAAPFVEPLRIMRERLQLMRDNITGDMLKRWAEGVDAFGPAQRLALLCGHPRSGTTLLEQVLDSHPEIVSAEETEIFHNEAYLTLTEGLPEGSRMLEVLGAADPAKIERARAKYRRAMNLCLETPLGSRLLIDKNPSLTFLIPAVVRVFPEIKFLIALRDPRDVVLSCFTQPMFPIGMTNSTYLSLATTVKEYTALMSNWIRLKSMLPTPWIEIYYEDMVADLESVARKALEFLGVPWDEGVLGFDEHARQKLVRSPTYADVTQKVFTRARGRWRNYQKYLEPHLATLEPFVKAFGYE
jgi:tetratricopeptide (TPR) repeat protein